MLARDHYATLGVPPNATADDIDQAYRHLSRRYHPDINPGDAHAAVVFERIEEAYQILSDPDRRARYDRDGSLTEARRVETPPLRLEVLPESVGEGSYGDLFRRLREHVRRATPKRGDDIHTSISVPMLQAERGRRARVTTARRVECNGCNGRGRVRLQRSRPCERCNGVGEETFVKGSLSVSCPCADCHGSGLTVGAPCEACHGSGLKARDETVVVRVPPGVVDGQVVRVAGHGNHGPRGGPAGDLVVVCRVEPVPGFERRGPHVCTVVPVGVAEAVLGTKLAVQTIDGEEASLRIPPGTQNGREFRLRGRGLQLPDGRRGDMLVRVELRIPELVDEDSKDLLRRFAARNPVKPPTRSTTP